MRKSKKLKRLLGYTKPMRQKRWYAGQAPVYGDSDDGPVMRVRIGGHTIEAQNYVRRYSYHWHKERQRYWIDGRRVERRDTFKALIRSMGYEC